MSPAHSTKQSGMHVSASSPLLAWGLQFRTALSCCFDMCRCGAHLGSYEEGLKGRTDNSKKLVKHNQVGREEFTSNKLAPKLAQQLKVHLPIRQPCFQ